jgi:5'-3' exoribonuclease 2
MAGFVLPDPACIPGATFDSPLPSLSDIYNDQSISATFSFPPQATPHRSILLPGVRRAATTLSSYDKDNVRRGGGDRENNGFSGNQRSNPDRGPGFAKLDNRGGRGGYQGNQGNGGGAGGYQGGRYEQSQQQQQPQSRDAYSGYGQGAPAYGSSGSYNPRSGPPPVPSFPGKYGYQPAPNPSDQGGYRPPTNNGYAVAPPANARYSSGPQLYGAANLGASQGQYGYSAPPPPPPAANGNGSRAPPYSGYGGYTGTQAPQQPRRY